MYAYVSLEMKRLGLFGRRRRSGALLARNGGAEKKLLSYGAELGVIIEQLVNKNVACIKKVVVNKV